MRSEKLTCGTCAGSGKWVSPAVHSFAGLLPEREVPCVGCGGEGFVIRETDEPQDQAARMARLAMAVPGPRRELPLDMRAEARTRRLALTKSETA